MLLINKEVIKNIISNDKNFEIINLLKKELK